MGTFISYGPTRTDCSEWITSLGGPHHIFQKVVKTWNQLFALNEELWFIFKFNSSKFCPNQTEGYFCIVVWTISVLPSLGCSTVVHRDKNSRWSSLSWSPACSEVTSRLSLLPVHIFGLIFLIVYLNRNYATFHDHDDNLKNDLQSYVNEDTMM